MRMGHRRWGKKAGKYVGRGNSLRQGRWPRNYEGRWARPAPWPWGGNTEKEAGLVHGISEDMTSDDGWQNLDSGYHCAVKGLVFAKRRITEQGPPRGGLSIVVSPRIRQGPHVLLCPVAPRICVELPHPPMPAPPAQGEFSQPHPQWGRSWHLFLPEQKFSFWEKYQKSVPVFCNKLGQLLMFKSFWVKSGIKFYQADEKKKIY